MSKVIDLKSDAFKILYLFLLWKILLIATLLYAIKFVPLGHTDRFLGGGPLIFPLVPELLSWANFDGEHYLAISIFGYKALEQAFFPVYPLLISFFAKPFYSNSFFTLVNSTIAGLLISNISFFLSLLILYKLILLDFSKKTALVTIIMLLIFPTSFYFGALYNESVFLLVSSSAFYLARKKRWVLGSIFGIVASATRAFGILLLPVFLIEAYLQKEKMKNYFWIFLIPLGLVLYMYYQYLTIGDPLAFYNLQSLVGEQHQSGVVLLPQVYFRYIKILLTLDIKNILYQTILLEFLVGIIFFLLPIIGFFKKVRISYLFYGLSAFLLPTIQGSFSSLPRYVIVIFPSFLILALIFSKQSAVYKLLWMILFITGLFIESMLFFRGYWVA